jgi:hypothetical protein
VAFAITPVAAKDGNQNAIVGGLDFVDTSGAGTGPWIITKVLIDPAGVNVQYVLSNNAAKCDLSSIGGTATSATSNASSAVAASASNVPTVAYSYGWNGATWDQLNATSGVLNVGGNVADAGADSGNPVKIGGVYNSTAPTYSTGQRATLQFESRGGVVVCLKNSASASFIGGNSNASDSVAASVGLSMTPFSIVFNGTNWDRVRNNTDTAALITLSGAGAGTTNSADQTNYNGRGVQIGVNITSIAVGTLTVNIQGKDIASGTYYTLLSTGALAAAAFSNITVYPGITVSANLDVSDVLPRTWRVQVVASAGITVSATVGASVIL